MSKNLHYPDCLLLHGWTIMKCDRSVHEQFAELARKEGKKVLPYKNFMYVSPRNKIYNTDSILQVPKQAYEDAVKHGDF